MKKYITLISSTLLVVLSASCYQTSKPINYRGYIVDNSIKSKVNQKVKSSSAGILSSMDMKMFENDSIVLDTYSAGKSIDECMTFALLEGDTINITGFAGMFAGVGYQIALFKDTCVVRHFAKSDMEVYKLHENDSLDLGVAVLCKTYTLNLASKPTFKKGDVVEGIIELTSDEYYEVANGNQKKCKMQLTGYFKTMPLESMEDEYNKIKNKLKDKW